jgi:hypothetical protein
MFCENYVTDLVAVSFKQVAFVVTRLVTREKSRVSSNHARNARAWHACCPLEKTGFPLFRIHCADNLTVSQ